MEVFASYKPNKMKKIYYLILFLAFISCKKQEKKSTIVDYEPIPQDVVDLVAGNNVYGKIMDTNNQPISGVVVSDGYSVVQTDAKGVYQFKKNQDAKFVFYSNPSGYEIKTESSAMKVPAFYKRLNINNNIFRADFTLKKLSKIETDFTLVCIGDPQVGSTDDVARFRNETLADLKQTLNAINKPAVGLALGDVVADKDNLLIPMKSLLGSTDMPIFVTIGNHDKFPGTGAAKDGEMFSDNYGPLNYSFNMGDVHFICLDNVNFSNNSTYDFNLTSTQIEWVANDLSYVPKDKMVIVYYHMPIRGGNMNNKTQLFDLLKNYKEVHLMSGHTHYNQNYIHTSPVRIYEHVHAAACGAWWKSTINGDGTPNGYAVYDIKGSTITNWYYKAVNYDKKFQLRLHKGNDSFGGSFGNFTYGLSNTVLVANVWNADPDWKVEVYEDGVKTGDMVLSTIITKDAWSLGYHLGVLNRNPANYTTYSPHLYTFVLKNPTAGIKVIATDRFGTVYEQDKITLDMLSAISY